ncbi:SDR family NAD(P)-dependent oxidoreductase [Streptomyces sp. NPDC049936]|uniref:SDR family NAD(P)-dependent oxidoreductase n=1 Tax=Streptomyces sp. NPDC049936 TaxID=3365599 RepID=UPI0037B20D02
MDLELAGRVAFVTGASGAIGGAIARHLALEGVRVVVGYYESEQAAADLVADLTESGHEAHAIRIDVRDSASVDTFVSRATALTGGPDCLINAAGTASFAATTSLTEEAWDSVLDTNLKGAYLCTRAVLPHMLREGSGDIVNVSSIAGSIGSYEGAAYAASKAGLNQFTKSLALELGSVGIRVNAVAPGRIDTPFRRQRAGRYFDFMLAQTPMRRMGTVEEVARAVAFLASRTSSFITGEILTVSGGLDTVFLEHVDPDPGSKLGSV